MNRGRATAPTRHGLLRARRRLRRLDKGADLLMRKRRALVSELFHLARPAVDARERLQEDANRAYQLLLRALSARDEREVRALGWPTRAVEVEVQPLNIWGTEALELTRTLPVQRTTTDRGTAPPLTGPAAADAAAAFEKLIEAVLDSASNEVAVRRLGEALGRASRQLNTLEKRLRPQLEHDIGRVRRTLDEREREDHTRLTRLNRRSATRRG